MKIPSFLLTLLLINISFAQGFAYDSKILTKENRALLLRLDSTLQRAPHYDAEKEASIIKLKAALAHTNNPEPRYWLAMNIYDEYAAFNSDSAMKYVEITTDLAHRLNRTDLIVNAELNRAYVLSATGRLDDASKCISNLNGMPMTEEQRCNYADRALFLNTHRRQYLGEPSPEKTPYSAKVDSLINYAIEHISPDNPNYSWIVGWGHMRSKEDAQKAIQVVKPKVDASLFQTRRDAMNAWVLSRLYEYEESPQLKLKYLILSAISDVKAGVKEMASLQEISQILIDEGDFKRANEYINYATNCAFTYKSRVRMEAMAWLKEQVMTQIMEQNSKETSRNHSMMIWLAIVAVSLLIAVIYIYRQMRMLTNSRQEVSIANAQLEKKVEELEEIRGELHESHQKLVGLLSEEKTNARKLASVNEVKERYIASIFTICSGYITKLDDFRKNISRMAKEKKYDELQKLAQNPELSYSEIKELYANFDRIFLEIYPDFVADFNSLLRPEERVELKTPNSLNTELRIYALVRLGLTDSIKIARFLHISPQTVYNTRQRTRNKAIGPRDSFAAAVANLGKHIF